MMNLVALGYSLMNRAIIISVNGKMVIMMDMELQQLGKNQRIEVFLKMEKKKDLEKKNHRRGIITMGHFSKGKKMARGNIFFRMGLIIKDILEIPNIVVMGISIQEMGNMLLGNSKKENQMGKLIWDLEMVLFSKEIFKMI